MRITAPLWAFPRRWRRRYGAEVEELFAQSGLPLSDWVDVVLTGLLIRLEEGMRSFLIVGLTGVAGVSLVAVGYTFAELSEGVREVYRHWWSTVPYVTFAASGAALLWVRRRPTQAPSL